MHDPGPKYSYLDIVHMCITYRDKIVTHNRLPHLPSPETPSALTRFTIASLEVIDENVETDMDLLTKKICQAHLTAVA